MAGFGTSVYWYGGWWSWHPRNDRYDWEPHPENRWKLLSAKCLSGLRSCCYAHLVCTVHTLSFSIFSQIPQYDWVRPITPDFKTTSQVSLFQPVPARVGQWGLELRPTTSAAEATSRGQHPWALAMNQGSMGWKSLRSIDFFHTVSRGYANCNTDTNHCSANLWGLERPDQQACAAMTAMTVSFCLGSLLESMNMSAMFTWAKCLHFGSSETVIITIKRKLCLTHSISHSFLSYVRIHSNWVQEGCHQGRRQDSNQWGEGCRSPAAGCGCFWVCSGDEGRFCQPWSPAYSGRSQWFWSDEAGVNGCGLGGVLWPFCSGRRNQCSDCSPYLGFGPWGWGRAHGDWQEVGRWLTETEMVGSFLQDQEKKDREQYVFLTQEDANMETVKDHLSDLTEHTSTGSVWEIFRRMWLDHKQMDQGGSKWSLLVMASSAWPAFQNHFHMFLAMFPPYLVDLQYRKLPSCSTFSVASPWPVLGWRGRWSATFSRSDPWSTASFCPGSSWSPRTRWASAMERWRRPMQEKPWRWCVPPAWHPGIPRRRSVSFASPRRKRCTTLSRWRACWWTANSGNFALTLTAPTTGRLRVWPRKRRMRPWWTFQTWPNRHHPAWTPARLLLPTKFLNHSASSWGTKLWPMPQILPWWKPWPSAMSDHTSSRRRTRMRARRFSTQERPRRWSWGRPHSVIPSNLHRWTWQRSRKQSHWRRKSLGRCRVGPWVWQTRRLWGPRCSDSWTWSTTKSAWRGATWMARGPASCRLKPASKKPGAELGTTGPWAEDGSRPPPDPRTTVLLVWSSQSGIRAECLRPGIWDGWCDGHWPWGGAHRVQGDEGLPADQQHQAICPQVALRASWDTSEGTGSRRDDGWTSPPGLQACTPHTDVQSSLRRTSPVWWSLEVGLWTFQSTQVGQAAETGGADSPRDPDSPSWLEELELHPVPLKLVCDQPQSRSVVVSGPPMMRSAIGRGRPRLGPCLLCSMSTAIAGQWRSCTASGVRCPWWSNVPAGDRERRPRNTRPTCRRPRMRCSSSWMPTTLEDPSLRQSGVNAIGSWASFWPCGHSWPTRHKWWWRFRWPQSRMTVNTWSWGQSVMNGFKEHPDIYDQIVAILPADQLMDVKVAWRCNTTQSAFRGCRTSLYAKLGYSAAAIEAMNLNPFGGHVNLTAQGAKLLEKEPAYSGHPNPGARQSGHSPAPWKGLRGGTQTTPSLWTTWSPPVGKTTWGRAILEAGAMPSQRAWNVAWFWAGKWSRKRRVWHVEAIAANGARASGNVVLQMVLDEPPERLYNRWVKDRIEFYKRLEPTAPLRDVPLKVDPNPVHRLRFSISNGLGNVSDAIWNIVLANPEKAGLEGIHHVADKHIGYWVYQGWLPPFCLLLFFALRLMDPPGCTLILLQQGGPRRALIATSLWEPTGWINRHLPGIDPRPMTGKKRGAAHSLPFTRQLGFLLSNFSQVLPGESFHFVTLMHVLLIDVVVCEVYSLVCFKFHHFELRTGGMLASCACLGGVAVLAHILKQDHYERQ